MIVAVIIVVHPNLNRAVNGNCYYPILFHTQTVS